MGLAEKELSTEVLRLDDAAGEGDVLFVEAGLDERTKGGGLLELMEELEHRLIEEVAEVERGDVVAQFSFVEVDVFQG